MGRAIGLQSLMTLLVAGVAGLVGGVPAALSAMFGGLAGVVPNAFFAWRLARTSRRPGGATVQAFVVGEAAKLAGTVLILLGVARSYHELVWPAFIVGFVAVLKSYFLMFLFGGRRGGTR